MIEQVCGDNRFVYEGVSVHKFNGKIESTPASASGLCKMALGSGARRAGAVASSARACFKFAALRVLQVATARLRYRSRAACCHYSYFKAVSCSRRAAGASDFSIAS